MLPSACTTNLAKKIAYNQKMYCQASVLYLFQMLLAALLQGWQKGGQGGLQPQ